MLNFFRSEERRVGKECRSLCDWSSDVCSSDLILGIMIFLIGHTFNIIIGVFEPGIQGARLIYVEFFSKFYHGAGKAFKPFGSKRRFTIDEYNIKMFKK